MKSIHAVPRWLSLNILIMTLAFSVSILSGGSVQESVPWATFAGMFAVLSSMIAGVPVVAMVGIATLIILPSSLLPIATRTDAISASVILTIAFVLVSFSIVRAREDVKFFVRRGFALLASVAVLPPCALWLYNNAHHVYAVLLIASGLILTHLFWPLCWEEHPELNRGLV